MLPDHCYLLNGCWIRGRCYVPPQLQQIQVRAGHDTHRRANPAGVDLFGQPECNRFDMKAGPKAFLKNYHTCRRSGCVIDSAGSLRQVVRKTASPQLRRKLFHCGFATRKFSVCDLRFACAIFIFAHSPQPQTTKMYREPF